MKVQIHFIGIGGVGVSALAQYYLAKGYKVSGCDLVSSEITEQLKKMGVRIRIGKPNASCVPANTGKIIYSPAVQKSSLEIENWKLKIPALSYPQALGEMTKKYFTIAVAGTHGKSTTTAMIGLLLAKAGLDPTVIVGTKLKEFGPSTSSGSNCRVGKSKYLVIEADEHFASFLNYRPTIAVLTSIEADHLDYYKNLKNLLRAFCSFVSRVPKRGAVVANKDDKNIGKILHILNSTTVKNRVYFSMRQKEAAVLRRILKIPGEHNVSNALAALAVARMLKIPDNISFKSLSQYKGSWRRFEIFNLKTKNYKPYTLVSDYGHHPTEIKATLQAARTKWPKKKIWLVFQPHQYQRTFYLWKGFVGTLSGVPADRVILADIYDVAGRENLTIKKKVSSQKLVKAMKQISSKKRRELFLFLGHPRAVEKYLKKNLEGGEVVIIIGAGDIYENLTIHLTRNMEKEKMNS